MKDHMFFLAFVFFGAVSYSQEFKIPADGALWDNAEMDGLTIPPEKYVERIEARGDTLINNIEYIKLYNTWRTTIVPVGYCEVLYWGGPSYVNIYRGAIRTNEEQRVCFIEPGDTTDRLLYDFSLSVGDTVQIDGYNEKYTAEVIGIDSIQINGINRKRMSIEGYLYDSWIEGIGSEFGLFAPWNRDWEFTNYELFSYAENNVLIYPERSDSDCNWLSIITYDERIRTNSSIKVYPNPILDRSYIEFTQGIIPKEVTIYEISGRKVFSITPNNAGNCIIKKQDLGEGIFILRVTDEDENLYQQILEVL